MHVQSAMPCLHTSENGVQLKPLKQFLLVGAEVLYYCKKNKVRSGYMSVRSIPGNEYES